MFWHLMLSQLFEVRSSKLRAQLWHAYPASLELRYALDRCGELAPSPQTASARIKHLSALLKPKYLLMAAEKLTVPGRVRPVALRQFEQKVLAIIDSAGDWIWHKPERKEPHDSQRTPPADSAA